MEVKEIESLGKVLSGVSTNMVGPTDAVGDDKPAQVTNQTKDVC